MKKNILVLLSGLLPILAFADNTFICPAPQYFVQNVLSAHKSGDVFKNFLNSGVDFQLAYDDGAPTPPAGDLSKLSFSDVYILNGDSTDPNKVTFACEYELNTSDNYYNYQISALNLKHSTLDPVVPTTGSRGNHATMIVNSYPGYICGFGNAVTACAENIQLG